LQKGAIASSVAHDSHNIIAVGVNDEAIRDAVNLVVEQKGGISLVSDEFREVLPLPVAGVMSNEDGFIVAEKYTRLNALAGKLGTTLPAPYMTLSFMALLVIPQLRISDKGLFDNASFAFIDLFVE
jgi:adenine deaminase